MEVGTRPKPKYLGIPNAIGIAEADAGRYLRACAGVTPNADLRCTLEIVAMTAGFDRVERALLRLAGQTERG